MNCRCFALIGLVVTMWATSEALADFMGLGATIRRVTTSSAIDVDVVELYATFDGAGDQAYAVTGSPTYPQILNSDSSGVGFFQVMLFGTHINVPIAASSVPDMAYDSFLSIGLRQFHGQGTFVLPTIESFNLADFNTGSTVVTTVDGNWTTPPNETETFAVAFPPPGTFDRVETPPGATHGVILGQFTVRVGKLFSGDLGELSIREAGVDRTVTRDDPANLNTMFGFQLELMPPASFELTAPIDGTYVTTRTPTLSWDSSSLAETYTVTIDDSAGMTSPLLVQSGITATTFNVPAGILTNGVTYWKVTAVNTDGSINGDPDPSDFAVVSACRQDLSGNGQVDFADILEIIATWGACD